MPRENFPSREKEDIAFATEGVRRLVAESRLPSKRYQSTVEFYGGKLKQEGGKLLWDRKGIRSKIDTAGDNPLRRVDDHVAKNFIKTAQREFPGITLKSMLSTGKRYCGNNTEILEQVDNLGLDDYYELDESSGQIEIKDPSLFTKGIALQDIYRADEIGDEELQNIDRFEALASAGGYIKSLHKKGAIGEVLPSDIIFAQEEGEEDKLSNPVLNIPDIVWNKERKTSDIDKKATDLLDFLSSIAVEEFRRSEDVGEIQKALETILDNYDAEDVIRMVQSYARRGRLTLTKEDELISAPKVSLGDKIKNSVFGQHNKVRLGKPPKDLEGLLRSFIIITCENYLDSKTNN